MRVCLFTDSYLPKIGGMQLAVHSLANALCDIGCDVTVVAKKIRMNGRFAHDYRIVRYGNLFPGSGCLKVDFISAIMLLMKEHGRKDFDIINCHGVSYAGSRIVFANRYLKRPLVMTPHGEDIQKVPEIGYGFRLRKNGDRIVKRNLFHADAVTAISDAVKNELRFLPEEKIFTIPNGIDTRLYQSGKCGFINELLSLDTQKKIVLSVGFNRAVKGYEFGIRAFDILKRRGGCDDLVYVIVGRNTSELQPLVHRLSLEGRVFLVPQQEREAIIKCYQSAWCFLSPSLIEGLSLVSIEAMATGLPLVVTDVPGNLDIVRDNRCGLVVKKRDPVALAEGIMKLKTDRSLYDTLSSRALEKVHVYDWRTIAEKYLSLYHLVLDRFQ